MKRRDFLGMTIAGMGSFLPACGGGGGGGAGMGGPMAPPPATSGAALAQGLPLRTLSTLANASTAAPDVVPT